MTRTEERCNWWTEIDDDILGCLAVGGALAPAEIGLRLGISEKATASLLSMLVGEGKVRICLVELQEAGNTPRSGDVFAFDASRPPFRKELSASKIGAAFAPDSDERAEQAEHPTRPTS